MSNRRMFSLDIVDSDAFLSMPATTQNLYFHLGMRADDDGVIDNPNSIKRVVGATDDDLRILIAKKFVIPFEENGLIIIKHWLIHNTIRKDRYVASKYQEQLQMLNLDENGSYTLLPNENGEETPLQIPQKKRKKTIRRFEKSKIRSDEK